MNHDASKNFLYKDLVISIFEKYMTNDIFDEEKVIKLGYNVYDEKSITYFYNEIDGIQKEVINSMLEKNVLDVDKYNKITFFFEHIKNTITFNYFKRNIEKINIIENELCGENIIPKIFMPSVILDGDKYNTFLSTLAKPTIKIENNNREIYKEIESIDMPENMKQDLYALFDKLNELITYLNENSETKSAIEMYSVYWQIKYLNLLIASSLSLYNAKKQEEIIAKTFKAHEMLSTSLYNVKKQSEAIAKDLKKQERLSKFNKLLSEINQHINIIENEKELLQKICDLTTTCTNVRLAWIGRPNKNGKMQFIAKSGKVGFLKGLSISINEEKQCPANIVWKEKKPIFINDVIDDNFTKLWQKKAKKFGIGEMIAIPILKNNNPYIIFNLYLPEDESFDEELIETINKIAKDIEHGIERIELLKKERKTNKLNQILLNNATVGILIVKLPELTIEHANKRFLKIFKIPLEKYIIGQSIKKLYLNDETSNTIINLTKSIFKQDYAVARNVLFKSFDYETPIHIDISGQLLKDNDDEIENNDFNRIVLTFVDVEERYCLEQELKKQATCDALTGLYNRRALEKELETAFKRTKRNKKILAVCMLDLDGFKPINDTYGHDAGDEVLKIISERLISTTRKTDFVARLGGDEFVILLEDLNRKDEVYPALERIENAITAPIILSNGKIVSVGASIGVVIYDSNDNDIEKEEEFIRLADKILYELKAHKKDRLSSYMIYGEKIKIKANNFQELLYKGSVEVFYQPILDLRQSKITGLEALARLKDENGEILSPEMFLNHLNTEDLYLLNSIIIYRVLKDIKELHSYGYDLWISINIDPRNLNSSFFSFIKDHLMRENIRPYNIILELLESHYFENQETVFKSISSLKDIGLRIAIDDVGSAYSSLMRIKDLPIDEIKLDQAFVRNLEKNPKDLFFIYAMNTLAENLNIKFVVEGVETKDILDALLVLGVNMVQGYFIAKPMPFKALKDFLKDNYNYPIPKEYPQTLLGVYAQNIVHYEYLKSVIRNNINSLDYKTLMDYRQCTVHKSLEKILPQKDYTLEALHKKYHYMIAQSIKKAINEKEPINWNELDKMHTYFQNYILDMYIRHKNKSQNVE